MKKSNFVAMILGVLSALFLGIGMCMALLPAWGAFAPGVVLGCIGLLLAAIGVMVWRKMERKTPIKMNGKTLRTLALGILGALALGVGMCLVMVWSQLIPGMIVGVVGILMLLCLVPMVRGLV